jgi:cyclic pyranopterin phosphate synthase
VSGLSHIDEEGRARMIDTSAKPETLRRAIASARVVMARETVEAIRQGHGPKGGIVEVARIAGIMAAKRTADLIPMCHPIPLTHIDIRVAFDADGIRLEAEARARAQTGVEMEALVAASVAALTVYDMCKALDRTMRITDVQLELKTGGKSGDYRRE